jgi:hypothetical protein
MAEPVTMTVLGTSLAIKAASLIGAGFFLAIGFWGGKRLTNKLDYFIYKHSKAKEHDCI